MTPHTDAVASIRAALGGLAASERRVAEVVLANPTAVLGMTASQLGSLAETSAMTVVRFARTAGFSGFQELAISLATRPAAPASRPMPLTESKDPASVVASVAEVAARALAACAETVAASAIAEAIARIQSAQHVLCLGAGLSHAVASDLAVRLNHLGISADAPADRQVQRARAMHLSPGSVCFAVLQGGTYPPVVAAARAARAAGAHVIALTPFRDTPLAQAANTALITGADEIRASTDAWPVRMQALLIVDTLIVTLMNTDPARYRGALQQLSDLIEQDQL